MSTLLHILVFDNTAPDSCCAKHSPLPIERPGLEEETREWREKRMEEEREMWVKRVEKGWERRRRRTILKLVFCVVLHVYNYYSYCME